MNNQDKNDPVEKNSNKQGSAEDGYPLYPATEDIYSTNKAETIIDPEDFSKMKKQPAKMEKSAAVNELNFAGDESGDDLDVPGSEQDNEQEAIGSEDEENNYYSIGGDNHNDLDEGRD